MSVKNTRFRLVMNFPRDCGPTQRPAGDGSYGAQFTTTSSLNKPISAPLWTYTALYSRSLCMVDGSVMSFGASGAAARAFRRSAGTLGSGSSPAGAISSVTTSPASAPAASRIFRFTLSQWLLWPSGSSVARKGDPLMVPLTVVMPRDGSFALASFGRVRKVKEPTLRVTPGRKGCFLKRILQAVLFIFACHH